MKRHLLAFSLLVIVSASCTSVPTRIPFSTITPDLSLLASPTAARLLATPSATDTEAPATATQATVTVAPVPAQRTPTLTPTLKPAGVVRSNPPALLTWKSGTAPIETQNLSIQYPNVIAAEDAKLHAAILERAYDTDLALFGNEHPFGKKISIVWDPSKDGGAVAGNPITICARCPNSFTIPPDGGLFHELVHDFTSTGRTRAARYITFNRAMSETFANYFAFYFLHEVLKYSASSMTGEEQFRSAALRQLSQYEAAGTSPYATPWKPYTMIDTVFTGMMFRVADQCGWGVWPKFFAAAFSSGNPGIPVQAIDQWEDMSQPAAKKAFGDFISFLSQSCAQDLRPMFKKWHFDLP